MALQVAARNAPCIKIAKRGFNVRFTTMNTTVGRATLMAESADAASMRFKHWWNRKQRARYGELMNHLVTQDDQVKEEAPAILYVLVHPNNR